VTDTDADADESPFESMLVCWLFHSLLNIPINYQAPIHPMALLPASASASTLNSNPNIADLFTKPLSRHRFATTTLIGDLHSTTPMTSVVSPTVDSSAAVNPTVVAPATTVPTATSDSVSHPVPYFVDTGASLPVAPSYPDLLPVTQAPYGLIRSPISVAFKVASTPTDPYTLITGEDTAIDLSFPDSDSVDTVEFASTLVYSSFRHFGTATLVFLTDANSKLISILVEPTQIDWLHWVPLPRLTPTESYFHISGLDYFQAFAMFHLIPIWIYLLHFTVNLE